ncbi:MULTISPECIES: ArsR/SmtB family transcription factor [unclassified Rhodococcus (in: high G+C Gram-positive bacteria)]|uniref:ArsR/SmtB family transcription factor n=1 Tax=unclassified Rhodococcus (in: high G+C Gram-positive bacteria) TaxID=192944 RepID=UPI00146BFAFD|nr:helix-turn-helix domain-containing protein [Rhodococcus sp. (in: high G+C Gram-positive bacteria)]MBF0662156.1 winged helix-turn-helix transcriptional regulator [Rhodococcus sp. (in: high G+C Gram-positive bacteria)]NMD96066.1 winged helix-turn-helix transcriptional regulator [Rhodococcus sp. BL-253-APC-6A1W]NME79008.1 winged helix-turn-helix transcriptional regulator [Rhodococcus sp. 105337]
MNDAYEARLTDLERRVHDLEAGATPAGTRTASDTPAPDASGRVAYSGTVALNGNIQWSIEYDAGAVLSLDPATVATVLDALGSSARLAIVRTLLRGPATAAELQDATELSSAGRLYHHLRALSAARIVEQETRSRYRIAPEKVVPLLVLALAAADVAERL